MKVRIKINCVVDIPGDTLPTCNPLDLIEKGVTVLKATEILPRARVSFGRTTERTTASARRGRR